MKPYGIIYSATAPDGRVYIGATTQRLCQRKSEHKMHKSQTLYAVIAAHGAAVKWEVLAQCDSQEQLEAAEELFIANFRDSGIPLFNKRGGGRRGKGAKHSAQTRAKMSATRKGKPKPPRTAEHCAALSAAGMGNKNASGKLTKQHRANQSAGQRRRRARERGELAL